MAQLNLNITPEFKKDLEKYMRQRGISTKSEAIRMALHELVTMLNVSKKSDFDSWLGAGLKAELKSTRKFKSEDDLWKIG
jgi:hypothetical protein